jgi:hypothetical protein
LRDYFFENPHSAVMALGGVRSTLHGPLTGTPVNVKVFKSVIHITLIHLILDSPKVLSRLPIEER